VEGDSQIIISMFLKLLNGSDPEKISPRWRLLSHIETPSILMFPHLVLIPSHVRREENKIADKLENVGVDYQE
jgi:hypothetical protein